MAERKPFQLINLRKDVLCIFKENLNLNFFRQAKTVMMRLIGRKDVNIGVLWIQLQSQIPRPAANKGKIFDN